MTVTSAILFLVEVSVEFDWLSVCALQYFSVALQDCVSELTLINKVYFPEKLSIGTKLCSHRFSGKEDVPCQTFWSTLHFSMR